MKTARYDIGEKSTLYGFISKNFERTVEYCSRCCYNSEDKISFDSWGSYILNRIKAGHESVIEHNAVVMMLISSTTSYINKWETAIYEGNNLIKVKKGKHGKDHYIIFSGNIHMFRDLIKNLDLSVSNNKKIYAMFSKLTDRMVKLKDKTISNIFTFDLPKINLSNIKNEIRCNGPVLEYVEPFNIQLDDDGLSLEILNVDNPLPRNSILINKKHKEIIKDNILCFGSVTFKITNPRIISQQDSRHREQAMSQKSQRFCDSKEGYDYYKPKLVDCDKEYYVNIPGKLGNRVVELSYNDYMELAIGMYEALKNDGILKETARFVLTNATKTEYCLTKSFLALPHYFYERTSQASQYEIRLPAIALQEYINKKFKQKLV